MFFNKSYLEITFQNILKSYGLIFSVFPQGLGGLMAGWFFRLFERQHQFKVFY